MNAGAQIGYLNQQKDIVKDLTGLASQLQQAETVQALVDLGNATNERFAALERALSQISAATANVLALAHEIRTAERHAQMAAARLKGEDFAVIDGKKIPIPVNNVYGEQYNLTKRRYENAFVEAKRLAYIARLAIEQRIGRRMNTIAGAVGPMEAPATWADDVCTASGINYEKWVKAEPEGAKAGSAVWTQSVAREAIQQWLQTRDMPFIGDYVAKLESFVEYYNIANPSHEGDDAVAISLRDNVIGVSNVCSVESQNLLRFSGALDRSDSEGEVTQGWLGSTCDPKQERCIDALPGLLLTSVDDAPLRTWAPIVPGSNKAGLGATWLREMTPAELGLPTLPPLDGINADAGVGDAGTGDVASAEAGAQGVGTEDGGVTSSPSNGQPSGVYQRVEVNTCGTYVLSWWDQARVRDTGAFYSTTPGSPGPEIARYGASVLDPSGRQIAAFSDTPYQAASSGAEAAGAWSARREISFSVSEPGEYTVSFSPSTSPGILGSVVIANVQLELGQSANAGASPYAQTDAMRQRLGRCSSISPAEFRKAFERRCDKQGCFYELKRPISLQAYDLVEGSPLGSKFARGNLNFRHGAVALNLVGTGLIDCAQNRSASCYTDSFARYTLGHDAYETGIISGYKGGEPDIQTFNFGSAEIRSGQALASEKTITTPISTADASLLSQMGVEKTEFTGRPLAGTYRLRIWESPELVWDRLTDIQLVLKYRYWSPVASAQ